MSAREEEVKTRVFRAIADIGSGISTPTGPTHKHPDAAIAPGRPVHQRPLRHLLSDQLLAVAVFLPWFQTDPTQHIGWNSAWPQRTSSDYFAKGR
jgi:hypothetical protein